MVLKCIMHASGGEKKSSDLFNHQPCELLRLAIGEILIGTNPMRVPHSDSIEEHRQKIKPIYSIVLGFRNLYLDFLYYRLVQPTNFIRKTSFFIIQGL